MNVLSEPGANERVLPVLLTEPVAVKQNALFHHILAGAGGYGDPLDRDVEHVLWDVIEEKVSIAHAAKAYGVVVTSGAALGVDKAGTDELRRRLRDERLT
jgi:N-methylhydantoinase B